MLDRIRSFLKPTAIVRQPEDDYVTIITRDGIKVEHPRRLTEEIGWNEIDEIKLVNTDEGPFFPDIWLVLIGKTRGCSIPHGSKGFEKVYDIVSKYDSFNFENVVASMSCTDNRSFDLWKSPT